ncbi:MAG: PA2779 family protein [Acidobacteriota bacterium]
MKASLIHLRTISLLVLLTLLSSTNAMALQTPSKTAPNQSIDDRQIELAKIQALVDDPVIARVLTEHGFSSEEAHQRLARLSADEIQTLSSQIDQVQVAGAAVPQYIWILLAVFLGVLIIVAIA